MVNPRGRGGGWGSRPRVWTEPPSDVHIRVTRDEADEIKAFARDNFPGVPLSEVIRRIVLAVARDEHELELIRPPR